ncbi:MAG: isochorismate synthase [Armatimonadota bacterium]|nr:isochorismate synthase [Armatimonadota bacterium]MDR7485822.1 isochorismate synthase [Armatimonadota bacterium]MDR7532119.1 isochorismate synthase [Armatimonadota bacterium]
MLVDHFRVAAAAGRQAAARLGRPVVVWASAAIPAVDPVALFTRAGRLGTPRVLWVRPADGESVVGIGAAWEARAEGPTRFGALHDAWHRCAAEAVGTGRGVGPVALVGCAFASTADPRSVWGAWPAGWLVVPALAVRTTGAGVEAVLSATVPAGADAPAGDVRHLAALLEPEDEPDCPGPAGATPDPVWRPRSAAAPAEEVPSTGRWKALVAEAAAAVRGGALRKVVLARAVSVAGIRTSPRTALQRLRAAYPQCALFAVARDGQYFLGATPERLLRVRAGMVQTGALAGSAPRGATAEEDCRLGEALLASAKNRVEHGLVVEAVREAMVTACDDVVTAAAPVLVRVSNVQHLYTPVQGRLRDPLALLDLAGRLHPTPAVGGVPQDAAMAWIARHEGFERGWYAGVIGWLDAAGDGELSVAIRSALVHGWQATLFAGCGIVADSDPQAEYVESCLKLRPLAEALDVPGALRGCW